MGVDLSPLYRLQLASNQATRPMIITRHTYSDLLHSGDRLAACEWDFGCTPAEGVAATLAVDPEAIILRVTDARGRVDRQIIGFAPGGMG